MRIAPFLWLSGCLTGAVNEVHEEVPLVAGITEVRVDVPAGDLVVEVAAVDEPQLARTIRWTGVEPVVTAVQEGSVLRIEVDCRSFQVACQVDHALRLPAPASLEAEIGTGAITVDGLAGTVDVRTGEGDVELSAVEGTVVASSGNGRVSVREVLGTLAVDSGTGDLFAVAADVTELLATTGSGNVDLEIVGAPERVTVDAGAGDLRLAVPIGTYRIDARTGSGQVSISGLASDEDAAAMLDLETGKGDVMVEGTPAPDEDRLR